MTTRAARAAALVAVLIASLLVGMAGAVAQSQGDEEQDPPRATLSAGSGGAGDTIEVRGDGWPAQSVVQAQVCGNLHLNGSIDCLRSNAVTKAVNTEGRFSVTLVVDVPPTPCPCVVAVATFDGRFPIDLPFEVVGAPIGEPTRSEASVPEFRLLDTEVIDDPSLGSRFGFADTRTVASTIRNVGSSPIAELPVTVTFGQGDDPSQVIATRTVKDLEPGQERTIRVPVSIDALSAGSSTVVVTVGEGNQSVSESVTISTFPWMLVLLVIVIAIIVLVVIFVRLSRSRRAVPPSSGSGAPGPDPGSFDPDALEQDLSDQLQAALLAIPASIRAGSPDVVADQVAPKLAAELAARHHLDQTAQESLEVGIRSELRSSLAAGSAAAPDPATSVDDPVAAVAATADGA